MLTLISSQTSLNFHYCTLWKKILPAVLQLVILIFISSSILQIISLISSVINSYESERIWKQQKEQSLKKNKVSTITGLQRDAVKESGIGLLPEHCSYFEGKYHFLWQWIFLKYMYSDANICISGKLLWQQNVSNLPKVGASCRS